MTLLAAGKVNYRSRIERAQLLAERLPFAREILGVYAEIAPDSGPTRSMLPPTQDGGGNSLGHYADAVLEIRVGRAGFGETIDGVFGSRVSSALR